jgi:hypothetical protein
LTVQLLDDLRAQRPRDLQDRLRVRHFPRIDAGEGAIDQIGADLALEIVIAPIEEMLQDQHPQHDVGRRPGAAPGADFAAGGPSSAWTTVSITASSSSSVSIRRNQSGQQLVPVCQEHFEQTALALATLNHARSFDEKSRAGRVVRPIDRRNAE